VMTSADVSSAGPAQSSAALLRRSRGRVQLPTDKAAKHAAVVGAAGAREGALAAPVVAAVRELSARRAAPGD
jgi:hypothetical protein